MTPKPNIRFRSSTYLQAINVLISITTALFLLGLCGLLVLQANQLGKLIKENLEVQVFLQHHLSEPQKQQIKQAIQKRNFVAKNKPIAFVSKEKAAESLKNQVQENFQELLDDNPLHDAFLVKIDPVWYESNEIQKIKQQLEGIEGVYDVSIVENLIQEINQNLTKIGLFFLAFGAFVIFTVFLLIDHIIKISLFAQRLLIRSMQLVGATDAFIRLPFIRQFALQGGLSGLLATLFLWGFLKYLHTQIEELASLYSITHVLIILFALVGIGITIGTWSTFRATKKYLKMPLDKLY
ncbi:hypothetical protein BKI52_16855 [marine bacterium AO1-C]|nr:hypothetical protein BKI52_16855 [marine bacterium AO1-C]